MVYYTVRYPKSEIKEYYLPDIYYEYGFKDSVKYYDKDVYNISDLYDFKTIDENTFEFVPTIVANSLNRLLEIENKPNSKFFSLTNIKDMYFELNQSDKDGNTPLHWASRWGNVEIVKLLLQAGALQKQDKNGITPRCWSIRFNHTEIINILDVC